MFADVGLASRLERAEGKACAAFVEARGGSGDSGWVEIGGTYAMFDGVESPLTQTFGLGMLEPATDSVLSQIEDFFRSHNAPVKHEVSPLAGLAVSQSLAERRYIPCELSNVLFQEIGEGWREPALHPNLTIRIAAPEAADVYNRAATEGWRDYGEVAALVSDTARVMFAAKGYQGFLVEQGGRIVATAGLVIHDGVALCAGASTIPEARGQGAQRAVLGARLQHAAAVGCDLAMMVVEPGSASQRNSERSGFRIAYTRTKWRLSHPAR